MYLWIHWFNDEQIFVTQIHNYFLANVLVGNACSLPQQCNGTGHSEVCSYGVCRCQQGYLQINGTCYQGTHMKKIDNFVTKEFSQETSMCTYRMQIVWVKNVGLSLQIWIISVMSFLTSLFQAVKYTQKLQLTVIVVK